VHYLMARLPSRERAEAMKHWGFSATESKVTDEVPSEAYRFRNLLQSRKMEAPEEAYRLLVRTSPTVIAFVLTEWSTSGAAMRIRNYLTKWHPLRLNLPVSELSALGVPSGPKFDEVIEKFFVMQLRGRARDPEERPKILKKLAGIKDEPSKKPKPDKGRRKDKSVEDPAAPTPKESVPAQPVKTRIGSRIGTAKLPSERKSGSGGGSAAGHRRKPKKKQRKERKRTKLTREVAPPKRRDAKRSARKQSQRMVKVKRKHKKTYGGKKRGGKRR
jgi:hypothetical protein